MKFGKIHRQTVETRMPQWRDHCVDYKALKKAIKKQMAAGVQGKSWLKHQRAISRAILLTRSSIPVPCRTNAGGGRGGLHTTSRHSRREGE